MGFVDREFREFEYNNYLLDKLGTHKINDRLIWSRGHSIENYFFEIHTLEDAFSNYLVSHLYQEAFEIFESNFDDIMRIACALSLAGLSEDLLKVISKSLDWKCITITSKSVELNLEEWEKILKKFNLDQIRINNLIDKFKTYLEMIYKHDVEIARWLSHGHTGFNLMFAVYSKCLYIVALSTQTKNPAEEAEKVNKNKDMRFSIVANAWIRKQSLDLQNNDTQDFPIKCFSMLIENLE